ncbi:MmcQ/YjbR family DNA-binding protein [Rhizobium sp. CRIBSB]|uniref:DNA-binding protein (MmcQ/YjbR family) n=1 Tax=Peteryoungia aggregata LMG 23059 TaxID=1368425 RepID=A0ABU0G450_9HYPH|nr:MmcQ/YjbR family DNA-binding protein [Peteryoungia aggregata]MDQ0420104.1 putative DNA-binding protein (MmcQ/YjbR family) [Peteryoungia aggregata LMG 23059]NBB50465.1 MmcQ/YjbR family DNA-binding protein [Rhizobium sp. CRIBSB]
MSLFSRPDFEAYVRGLTGTTLVDQWDARIAKVGNKVFALLTDGENRLAFKVSEESFEILTSLKGVSQAPYFAKRKWVTVEPATELNEADLVEYIGRSYRTVAGSLTRKVQAELGIIL